MIQFCQTGPSPALTSGLAFLLSFNAKSKSRECGQEVIAASVDQTPIDCSNAQIRPELRRAWALRSGSVRHSSMAQTDSLFFLHLYMAS